MVILFCKGTCHITVKIILAWLFFLNERNIFLYVHMTFSSSFVTYDVLVLLNSSASQTSFTCGYVILRVYYVKCSFYDFGFDTTRTTYL